MTIKEFNLIHVSFAKVYRYKGVTFELHYWMGPIILRRDSEQERKYKNVSCRIWQIVMKFMLKTDEEKQQYRFY